MVDQGTRYKNKHAKQAKKKYAWIRCTTTSSGDQQQKESTSKTGALVVKRLRGDTYTRTIRQLGRVEGTGVVSVPCLEVGMVINLPPPLSKVVNAVLPSPLPITELPSSDLHMVHTPYLVRVLGCQLTSGVWCCHATTRRQVCFCVCSLGDQK